MRGWIFWELGVALGFCLAGIQSRISTTRTFPILENPNAIGIEWRDETSGNILLRGALGLSLPTAVGTGIACGENNATKSREPPNDICLDFGDYAKLIHTFSINVDEDLNCSRIEWSSPFSRRLEDCFELGDIHWYGGGTLYNQTWPLAKDVDYVEHPFITGDYTSTVTGAVYGGIIERYFLLSTGVVIHIDEEIPLFVRWSGSDNRMCLVSKDEHPYQRRFGLTLKYDVCIGKNVREASIKTLKRYYETPTMAPDEGMMLRPFWSTWNEFNANVNQSIVLEHAQRILSENFTRNSHFEIDDGWEASYGQNEFDLVKFPDPVGMVQSLNEMGFNVTLWTHPFINFDSTVFREALEQDYLLRDPKGNTALASWWHGDAGVLDFTNPEAVSWWIGRLERLRTEIGISSFKFDAGECDRLPHAFSLNESLATKDFWPTFYTKAYVEAVSSFGGMIEVRTGRGNQNLPIFFRMLDKGSRWGYDNGLQSLIPSLLQFGILGYSFVLPDMIGGNNYKPSAELWVRWMEANTFMPSVQFSIVPWSYDEEWVSTIAREMLAIREQNAQVILKAVNQSLEMGIPINRPMWFVDPEDPITFTVDDQYMLGDDVLVAPVLLENARSRNIYFPRGNWLTPDGEIIIGPTLVENYPADLAQLPYFYREKDE